MLALSLLLALSSLALARAESETCSKFLTSNLYEELSCKPNFENGAKCPTSFDCSDYQTRDERKCRFRGKTYDVGSSVPDTERDKCSASCNCIQDEGGKPYLRCVNIECPELFLGPPKDPKCKRLYSDTTCCSTGQHCPGDSTKLATCEYNNNTYVEGEKFYPEEEPCKVCSCKAGFTGKLEEPFCSDVHCNAELHYGRRLNDQCVPVYYGNSGCCPIDWRCPSATDKSKEPIEKIASLTAAKCRFGSLELKQNDILESSEEDIDCRCSLPPFITCVRKART